MTLKSINFNNSIDTSNVIIMSYIFDNCRNLESLNISSFVIQDGCKVDLMFGCHPSCGVWPDDLV